MDDLVTWLRAQLDEDERAARLALEDAQWARSKLDHTDYGTREIVKLLALPYADQPGYREEWRPA